MAFDSSPGRQLPRRSSQANLPEVPRPQADMWNSLRDDGIQWEGQVLIVGNGVDIPALLVLTNSRFVVISGGDIALEAPRSWLRPEPRLLAGSDLRISMTPQGGTHKTDDTDRLMLRVRDGRGAAAKLASTISGRLVSPREDHGIRQSNQASTWGTSIGASTPIALPPLPDFDDEESGTRDPKRQWPPIEQGAIPPPAPSTPASAQASADTSISTWAATHLPESTGTGAPVSRRAARSAAARGPVVVPAPDAPLMEERHQFNRNLVWGLRSLILAVVIGTGLYFGRDSLPANLDFTLPDDLKGRFGLDENQQTPDVSQLLAGDPQMGSTDNPETPEATKADSDGTNGPPNSDTIGTTATDDNGLGGENGIITPANPGIGEYSEPTDTPQEDTTADQPVTQEPAGTTEDETTAPQVTESPVEPTQVPATEEPATEVPATEAPETEVPATEVPVTEAPETEQPATEIPATEQPATEEPVTAIPITEVPATETPAIGTPTEVPGRQDETETPATEVPATAEPTATLESQPPSVDPGSTPDQSLANGTFRYTVTGASRGDTVSELPEINSVGDYGEWVVLSMYGENWSDTQQVFDISQFKLYADGEEVLLDVGNAWVNGMLGYTPAYGNTDAILWAPDESHPFALTFLAPPDAQHLTLVAGDQTMDLSAALNNPQPLSQDAAAPAGPEYIEATVVEVVNADTIVIDIDGVQQTVRYLGLDVPTDDDCYANDATAANRALVEGKTVRLERQATDVDARGNWVRDVWAPADDGRYFLVSEALVSQGAATVGISDPNTRYAGWLMGSQSAAKAEQRGLWATCGEDGTLAIPSQPVAVAPELNRVNYRRTKRRP